MASGKGGLGRTEARPGDLGLEPLGRARSFPRQAPLAWVWGVSASSCQGPPAFSPQQFAGVSRPLPLFLRAYALVVRSHQDRRRSLALLVGSPAFSCLQPFTSHLWRGFSKYSRFAK